MLIPPEIQRLSDAPVLKRTSTGLSNLYDVVFVLNINSKGWILEKICKVIAGQLGLRTTIIFTERNNTVTGWLPSARSYFFSHYKIYMGALSSGILPADSKTYVWFTHPSFSGGNTVEAFVAALNECTTIFTANSFHSAALAFLGIQPDKLKTVLGGADPAHFKPTPRTGKAVGIVGAYYERKNPGLLLDVVRAMPDVSFLLIAPHPSEVENKSLLWENWSRFPELRELPNFHYVSARFEDFGEHYAHMDVYLSLSKLEGGPIPLIEAMFANCYPVATRTGFAEDIVTHGSNGLLLPISPAIEQVEQAIRTALDDRTTDVAATVANYSWEAFGLNFRDAIDPHVPVGRRVSFALNESPIDYLREGWGDQDSAGTWLAMKMGTLCLRLARGSKAVAISFLAQPAMGLEGVPLRLRLNGRIVEDAVFEGGPHIREVPLTPKDVEGALTVVMELTASRLENLGTICLESLTPITREAVVNAPDAAGFVHSSWEVEESFEVNSVFDVPVVFLGAPDRPQSRQMRRALHASLGIPTFPNDRRFEPGWDGIAIADGVASSRLSQFGQVDGVVARTSEEKLALLEVAPEVPAIVIPEIVGAPLTGRTATLEPSISTAVIFGLALRSDQNSYAWISDVLGSKGIKAIVSEAAASATSANAADARSAVATAAQGADLCFFSGAVEELPFISTCLGMGIPVLLYGPSELYPALAAHGLRYAFIQNASRLTKTLSMLAEVRARRTITQELKQLLESSRSLQAATERYAAFARGLINQRKLARLRPNVGIVCLAPSNGEDAAYIAAAISFILDAGCQVSVLCASQDVEIPISHPGLAVTFMGQEAGSKSALSSPTARLRLSTFVKEHRPELFLCFSETSLNFVKAAGESSVPSVYVAGTNAANEAGSAFIAETYATIRSPRLLPPKLSASVVTAIGKDKIAIRKKIGFRTDEVVVFCASEHHRSRHHDARIADALEIAREAGSRVRFVVEAGEDQFGGGIIERLRKRAAGRQSVVVSNVDPELRDLAMGAADFALITAAPYDATVFSRALAFGLPILAPSDVIGADLLGPRVSGATFDPDNREGFENNLKVLLTDAPLRQKLSAQARATFAGLPSYDETKFAYASGIADALDL